MLGLSYTPATYWPEIEEVGGITSWVSIEISGVTCVLTVFKGFNNLLDVFIKIRTGDKLVNDIYNAEFYYTNLNGIQDAVNNIDVNILKTSVLVELFS
jgi:hypothetical protein